VSNALELQQEGIQFFQQREYEAAAQRFQQAREAYEAAGQQDMAAEMRVNLGLVHRALGEYDRAAALMHEALAFFSEINDEKRAAQVLGNLGGVYAAQGDTEQALTCYRQAADILKAQGEEELYGKTLLAMGDLQVRSGQVMSGAALYEVGLDSIDDLSGTQKILKGLLGIKRRLIGGPPLPPAAEDESKPEE